jgi:hypothetical protein
MTYYLFDMKGWPQIVVDEDRHLLEGYSLLGSFESPETLLAAYDEAREQMPGPGTESSCEASS